MNKLFNFTQAKGKWHKFPCFNLGGGAKLYKNFAQKLLAVSLCAAMVLMWVPFSRDTNVEAADAYSVVRLTVTEPYTDDSGDAVPLSMVSSWDSFVPGAPTRLVVEFVYAPSSGTAPVTQDVLEWYAKYLEWSAEYGEQPSTSPDYEPFVPSGWYSSHLGVAFHFGSRVDNAHLLFSFRSATGEFISGQDWSGTGYSWGASVPAFTLLVTKNDLQTDRATSAAIARVCVGGFLPVSMASLFGSSASVGSVESSDTSVAEFDPATSSISGGTPGDATLTFKDASNVAIGSVVVSVDASGHVWDGGQVTQQPTCTAPGVMTYTCQNACGATQTRELPIDPDAHDLSDVVLSAPTAEKLGEVHSVCSRCDYDVFAHFTFEDGASPTMYPDGTRISDSDSTPRAAKTFDLNGQALTILLQDPLGALGAGSLDLEVHPIDLPGDFDGDVDVEHAHAYEIVPTVNGVEKSGELSNKVRLLYKIPQGWDRDDLEVFLAQAGQDMEFSETTETVGDDEYLVVWTDHFSPYVFVDKLNPEEKAALETKPNPDDPNGDSNTHQNGAIITTDSPQADSGNDQTTGDHSIKTGDASGEILMLSTLAMIATGLYLGLFLKKKKSF